MLFDDFPILDYDLTLVEAVTRFTVALVCGLVISVFYRASFKGTTYSSQFVISLISLSMITCSVIMVIGNDLARAFGLVGAMSIIRFRSAVKDTQDIVFIFFALAMGMAAGVGLTAVAVAGTLLIGVTVWVLTTLNYASPVKKEYLLQFNYAPIGDGEPSYVPVLNRHCRRQKLINVKSVGENGKLLELSFYVNLRKSDFSDTLMKDLTAINGVSRANLYFDEVQV